MEENILKRASLNALCDYLGYEEGKVYFDMLIKKEMSEEYSHSKSYRLLKSLFDLGAAAKIKEKDISVYVPLPPTFLIEEVKDAKIIDYLEKIYLKNHLDIFQDKYLQISLKGAFQESLVIFLIKHLMKKSALIISGGVVDYNYFRANLDKDKLDKISYFCRKDYSETVPSNANIIRVDPVKISNRRIILIDGRLLIELLKLPNIDSVNHPEKTVYIGYLLSKNFMVNTPSGKENYIQQIEKEIQELYKLSNI
jgi:hypothetical protein